jgi:hypothetical protein
MHSVMGRSQQGLPLSQHSEETSGTEEGIQNSSILGLDTECDGGFGFRRLAGSGCDISPTERTVGVTAVTERFRP